MEEIKKTDANVNDDVKNDGTTNEENQSKTYTQEEFNKAVEEAVKAKLDEARKNGFAEGQRKASKNVNEGLKTENQDLMNRLATLESEILMQKHFAKLGELNVKEANKQDVLDLLRVRGLEINDENISKMVSSHPEWIIPKEKNGVVEMGQTKPQIDKDADTLKQEKLRANFRKRLGLKDK